jgi:hypothetical protein
MFCELYPIKFHYLIFPEYSTAPKNNRFPPTSETIDVE